MKMRALIVDDEYPARKELRYLLQPYEFIKVVGEATNSVEAIELIESMDYSVLFLDIEMPGLNGIELAEQLKDKPNPPAIIFITAHENYALAAFSANAADYILKPINPKRLEEALQKVRKRVEALGEVAASAPPAAQAQPEAKPALGADMIPVEHRGKTILLHEQDIIFAYTDNDYVYVKTHSEKYLTRFTLKEMESRLNPNIFFRSHRCYLVNIRKTKELVPFFNGTYTLIVDDHEKSEVPVSRTQSKKLRELLGI
ncbi:MAG TPA: LytTR family DNA-binding domain-containing protein [Verrucomicrobiae bacterium]|nr:LytTR family DNA-binding domain-containing protein [Verrucomicrobiae bacterium]